MNLYFDKLIFQTDFATPYSFDYQTFILFNQKVRRYEEGPLQIRMLMTYDTRKDVPDLQKIYVNGEIPYCVDRSLVSEYEIEMNKNRNSTQLSYEEIETTTTVPIETTSRTTESEPIRSSTRPTPSTTVESLRTRPTTPTTPSPTKDSSRMRTPPMQKGSSNYSSATTQSYLDIVSNKYNSRTTTVKPSYRPQKETTKSNLVI